MQIDKILIIDLGSKENIRLAREIRQLKVYSQVLPYDITAAELEKINDLRGVIINGGPNRIVEGEEINPSQAIFDLGLPVLKASYDEYDDLPADEDKRLQLLDEFIFKTCKAEPNWTMENFIKWQVDAIKETVGEKKVLLALSGGVDSTVLATLLSRSIGDQLTMIHVNTGLMRKNESKTICQYFNEEFPSKLIYVDASERFLSKLESVSDPEKKRKIIGNEFINVFEEEAHKLHDVEFLAQGTIYSDVIESGSKTSKAVKSHHNVGGLPEHLELDLIEPLSNLFKDEVRAAGLVLGVPEELVYRQPFPGPGLAVRCLGAITRDRLEAVRESDAILREEFAKAGLNKTVWQYFTVVPEFKSVGIKNGKRAYEWSCIIRAVNSVDAMTASIEALPYDLLHRLTDRITSEVDGINRVLYDLTPKPTGTIEWE